MSIDIFAITIARVDGETQVPARATIRVEVAAGEIRVTDVNIRADESGSVDKASLPVSSHRFSWGTRRLLDQK